MQSASENYFVLWSGGLDSTYLIWKLLKNGHTVYAKYVTIGNNKKQTDMEHDARCKLWPIFKKEFGDRFICNCPLMIPLAFEITVTISNNLMFHQAMIWLLAIQYIVPKECETIAIGYIKTDSIVPYIDNVKKIHNEMQFFSYNKKELLFPLLEMNKCDILTGLPHNYVKECYSNNE